MVERGNYASVTENTYVLGYGRPASGCSASRICAEAQVNAGATAPLSNPVAKSLKDMVARDGVEPPTPAFSVLH